jgi:hypothetical protein
MPAQTAAGRCVPTSVENHAFCNRANALAPVSYEPLRFFTQERGVLAIPIRIGDARFGQEQPMAKLTERGEEGIEKFRRYPFRLKIIRFRQQAMFPNLFFSPRRCSERFSNLE